MKQFRATVYGRPIESCTWAFQTHYWTAKIQDGQDPPSWKSIWRDFLFRWGWSDLDKISQTGAKWHVNCGDMVKIETICRIPIWRTFGEIQWHVIPEPLATLQGAATWWIHCRDSRATWRNQCHDRATLQGVIIPSAILKIVFRHILFYFFGFLNPVWALMSSGFRIVSDALVIYITQLQRCILVKFECVQYVVKKLVIAQKYSAARLAHRPKLWLQPNFIRACSVHLYDV